MRVVTSHVEVVCAIVRLYRGGRGYGDPYDLAFCVVGDDGTATIKGLTAVDFTMGAADRRAIGDSLRAVGFHAVRWGRSPGHPGQAHPTDRGADDAGD